MKKFEDQNHEDLEAFFFYRRNGRFPPPQIS